MKLVKVKIKNYKSIEEEKTCNIDVDNINIYIGENNVGKSTILEAISMLKHESIKQNDVYPIHISDTNGETKFTYYFESGDEKISIKQVYAYDSTKHAYKKGKIFINDIEMSTTYLKKNNTTLPEEYERFSIPEVFYISTETSEAQFSKMIDSYIKMQIVITDEKLQEINDLQEDFMNPIIENLNERLTPIYESVGSQIGDIFSTYDVNYRINPELHRFTKADIIEKVTTNSEFGQINANLHGTGFQRALLLLLMKESMNTDVMQHSILLIDEPEAFIHPQAIKSLQEVLYNINGIQIIISTHSPQFISIEDYRRNIKVIEQLRTGEKTIFESDSSILKESEKKQLQLQNISNSNLFDFFFARKIIIVEGDVEHYLFTTILKEPQFREYRNTTKIINARGKSTIINFMKILNSYKQEYSVCFDLDNININKDGSIKEQRAIKAQRTNCRNIVNKATKTSTIIAIENTLEFVLLGERIPNSEKIANCLKILKSVESKETLNNLVHVLLTGTSDAELKNIYAINTLDDIDEKFAKIITQD